MPWAPTLTTLAVSTSHLAVEAVFLESHYQAEKVDLPQPLTPLWPRLLLVPSPKNVQSFPSFSLLAAALCWLEQMKRNVFTGEENVMRSLHLMVGTTVIYVFWCKKNHMIFVKYSCIQETNCSSSAPAVTDVTSGLVSRGKKWSFQFFRMAESQKRISKTFLLYKTYLATFSRRKFQRKNKQVKITTSRAIGD